MKSKIIRIAVATLAVFVLSNGGAAFAAKGPTGPQTQDTSWG